MPLDLDDTAVIQPWDHFHERYDKIENNGDDQKPFELHARSIYLKYLITHNCEVGKLEQIGTFLMGLKRK